MSTVVNERVKMHFKAATVNIFTVVRLLVEPSIDITKPKVYLEASPSIRQPSIIVTSNRPVIP